MNTEELQEAYGNPSRGWPKTLEYARQVADAMGFRNSYDRVKEFHEVFGHPVAETPVVPNDDRMTLRLALILEETIELADAMGFSTEFLKHEVDNLLKIGPDASKASLIGIADALGDIEYVVNGAALEHGIPLPSVVAEIHRSNMTKLGPDGKPIYREDGKILKGEGYEPPNLESVLFV